MRPRRPWAAVGAAALAAGVVLAAWVGATERLALRAHLAVVTPAAIQLAVVLWLGSLWALRRRLAASLVGPRWAALAVFVAGLVLVHTLPPRTHRIFYDEDIYENVAQNILWTGRAEMCNEGLVEHGRFRCLGSEYNKEPNGFPVLLSLAFRPYGVDEAVAHEANHVLFALGGLAAYWLGGLFFRRADAAGLAALVYLATPQNLLWGATVAAEPGAASLAAVALGATILLVREPRASTAVFAASSVALAAQMRPESILVVLPAAAAALLLGEGRWREGAVAGAAVLALWLLVPHGAHLAAVSGEGWGSPEGEKFSTRYVAGNLRTNAWFYVENRDYPALFTALALVGLFAGGAGRARIVLALWLALFFGVFVPFHAGSYRYGADVRFSVLVAMPLALAAGAGATRLVDALGRRRGGTTLGLGAPAAAILYVASAFLPLVRSVGEEAWAARADHEAARAMLAHVPEGSIVLTHNPGMWQVMGQSAVQTSIATYQPAVTDSYFRRFAGGVYFHFNFWCNVPDPVQNEFCNHVLREYPAEVVVETSAGFYRYVLYRLLPRRAAPPDPTGR